MFNNYRSNSYYSDSSDATEYYESSGSESVDPNEPTECDYCIHIMPAFAMKGHIERKHTCNICLHRMPVNALQQHVQKEHIRCYNCLASMLKTSLDGHQKKCWAKCQICENKMPVASLQGHIGAKHRLIGEIVNTSITVQQLNKLLAEGRVRTEYNGKIYMK